MKTKLKHLKFLCYFLPLGLSVAFLISCDEDEKPRTEPIVTTAAVSEITTTSAMGGGEITSDGSSPVAESGLVYSHIVSEPTIADDKIVVIATTGSFSGLMEGLLSGTTYHVRAYATNAIGTGYGAVVDFTTGNGAPTASDVSINGNLEANQKLTAVYTYSDAEDDAERGTTFQWYVADDAMGTGEAVIEGATESTYLIAETLEGKYIGVGVTPQAGTGTAAGTEVKSVFMGAVGEATTVTFTYNDQEVTYGIISSATTGKKWLDRNLGAANIPTAFDDYANYGDLFQWGRDADGHQLISRTGPEIADMTGVNGTTSTVVPFEYSSNDNPGHSKFIVVDKSVAPYDWRTPGNNDLWQEVNGINNPCPGGWHIATQEEWAAEGITSIEDGYTKLNLTLSGYRGGADGIFYGSTAGGYYWSSSTAIYSSDGTETYATRIRFNTSSYNELATSRAGGYACRCIKD